MIIVYVDITAPLYWWKEFDTYKVGTVANSCSTMHKIADKELRIERLLSHEHLGVHADPPEHSESTGEYGYQMPLAGGVEFRLILLNA
jgi:kynurenine formamidase